MKKRVFVYYYDKINLGDDLFVRFLADRYPGVRFYIWTDGRNIETFRDVPNISVVAGDGPITKFLGRLRDSFPPRYKTFLENRCRVHVYIGGSIFMEYPTWRYFVQWWQYRADKFRFYALGANFGPYRTEEYREKMEASFAYMQDVCFRERYSCGLFPRNQAVRYAPDILLAYPMPRTEPGKKQVFVSMIDCASRGKDSELYACEDRYIENMAAVLTGYLQDSYQVVLAGFCRDQGDMRGVQKVYDRLPRQWQGQVRCLAYEGTNTEQVLKELAQSAYVIATRFHATVLALAAGRPVLPLIYSDKTKHLLEDIGFTGLRLDLREEGIWDYAQSRKNLDDPAPKLAESVKRDALKHFERLDKELTRE